jgi:hypothetical protein
MPNGLAYDVSKRPEVQMRHVVLARFVAAAHLAFIALLVLGGPLGRRRRSLVTPHLGAVAAAAAINLTGSDCPITDWEKSLLRRAGREAYPNGFVSHYLIEPIRPAGIDARTNRVILASWIVPTAVAYLLRRRDHRSARR